jgi:L-2-hydroxyglutarate oxidase
VDCDVLVVGAGIVGLATAAEAARRGAHVVVVDKEPAVARHQTGRNSGVVHSGLYYAPGSAKAELVARGRQLLAERAAATGAFEVDWCGKVVVATRVTELDALAELERRGRANGVEVRRLTPSALAAIEPCVAGVAALHVPGAGITDFGAVARSLAEEVTVAGGEVRVHAEVRAVDPVRQRGGVRGLRVATTAGTISARALVNCAGLHSDRVARLCGADTAVRILPFRGEYQQLRASARELVRGLVYPVPDPRWPFLGVHLTRMLDGGVHVGPNAVLALGREAYERQIDPRELRALATAPGLRRLALRYWRTGAAELVRSRSPRLVLAEVRRLVPELRAEDLVPAGSGIRAQAIAPDGTLLDDFAFATSERSVHVLNAPSPAATASLAIAEVVVDRLVSVASPLPG